MRVAFPLLGAGLALPALLASGCGGGPSVVRVSGKVTLDGKPLPNAVVTFQPLRAGNNVNPGPGSEALTDADGNYTLKVVGGGKPGAVVGNHRVEISAYPSAPGADPTADRPGGGAAARNLVPPQYNDKTTLKFDVPRGGTTEANFALKSKP